MNRMKSRAKGVPKLHIIITKERDAEAAALFLSTFVKMVSSGIYIRG